MLNKIFAALVAGAVLVGAGLVTSALSSPGTAQAQEETESSEDGSAGSRLLGFLDEVLADLVADGTLTQEQADAVAEAAETKADEVKEAFRSQRELVRGLLEDGVITEEEASQLPEGNWLLSDRFDEAWEDGELTLAEIREQAPHPRWNGFEKGLRFGALLDDGGIDQEEYDSLGDDHPLKQVDVTEYLADGLITPQELREIHMDFRNSSGSDT